jgi:hypothetical protein
VKKCCPGVEEVLHEGVADLAISSFSIGGYLGAELSAVEFVAVAHPEHACTAWAAN